MRELTEYSDVFLENVAVLFFRFDWMSVSFGFFVGLSLGMFLGVIFFGHKRDIQFQYDEPKVHYERDGMILCYPKGFRHPVKTTTDINLTNCRRCLKLHNYYSKRVPP